MYDLVAHLEGDTTECLAKYIAQLIQQYAFPSWKLHPEYQMSCSKCSNVAYYVDLRDAYAHSWVPDHCPDHLPEYLNNPLEYAKLWQHRQLTAYVFGSTVEEEELPWRELRCIECKHEGVYKSVLDAEEQGWWYDRNTCWCPDHYTEGYNYTNGIIQLTCCMCNVTDTYENPEEALYHGWWTNQELHYCITHADEGFRQHKEKY